MKPLKLIRTDNEDLNRVQQNVQTAMAESVTSDDDVVSVNADYRARSTDFIIFVNASKGPVRIVLPVPGRATIVRKTDTSGNPVTVASSVPVAGAVRLTVAIPAATYGYDSESKGWFSI